MTLRKFHSDRGGKVRVPAACSRAVTLTLPLLRNGSLPLPLSRARGK
jgi:hypothetical protein